MNQETIEKVIDVGHVAIPHLYIIAILCMLAASTVEHRTIQKLIIGCIVLVGLSMIIVSVYVALYL